MLKKIIMMDHLKNVMQKRGDRQYWFSVNYIGRTFDFIFLYRQCRSALQKTLDDTCFTKVKTLAAKSLLNEDFCLGVCTALQLERIGVFNLVPLMSIV